MTKEEYLKELFDEVRKQIGDSMDTTPKEAFLDLVKPLLVDGNAIPDFHACPDEIEARAVKGAKACKVDGYHIPEENAAVIDLILVDWHEDAEVDKANLPTIPKAEIDRNFELLKNFFERSLNAQFQNSLTSEHARTAAEYILSNNASGAINRVRLILITNRVVAFQKLTSTEEGDGLIYERVIWDLERLRQLAEGGSSRGSIDIDFEEDYKKGLTCIHAQKATYNDTEMDVYLGVISGDVLADIYRNHGQRLMESNVRAYLQGKGKVNGGILKTANEEPELFIAYNNGICCTASHAVSKKLHGELSISRLDNFQIVNGGQTTASLYATTQKKVKGKVPDLSQVKVQFKLVVIHDSHHEDAARRRNSAESVDSLIHSVSRYSNSQNKISEVDLASNTAFHRRLEELSRTISAISESKPSRWYYERARGSYATDIAKITVESQRETFKQLYPSTQKFDKQDLGRLENIWRLEPHVVCKGAQASFVELMKFFGKNPPRVDADYFKHLIAKKILLKATDEALKGNGVKGHRAATACYILAWVFKKTNHRINLDKVWQNQSAGPALQLSLVEITDRAHQYISDYGEGKNMLSAFAQKTFWDKFSEQDFPLDPEIEKELLPEKPQQLFIRERSAMEERWDAVRHMYSASDRRISDLESETGRNTGIRFTELPIRTFAVQTWSDLSKEKRLTDSMRRKIVEMTEAHAAL